MTGGQHGDTAAERVAAGAASLRSRPIAATDKGFGRMAAAGGPPVTAAQLAAERPALFGGGFDMPVMVLREAALRQNIESMAAYCAAAGVLHAPHAKTTMAPQLIARQLAAGAWAVTAATIAHAQVYRAFGVPRVLIANELTERGAAEWLARELAADPGFDCYVYADSLAGVALLDEAGRSAGAGRPLKVLVELGYPGGRAGCRSVEDALAVAGAVESATGLELAGAAGYEGGIHHDDPQETLAAVASFCADLAALGELLPPPPPGAAAHILSAGGSSYFDVVCRELSAARPGQQPARVVLRSGAYISHDHGRYAATGPGSREAAGGPGSAAIPVFAPALELWASVLSVPEPGLAIVNAGRRDVSNDQGMPVPLSVRAPGGEAHGARDHGAGDHGAGDHGAGDHGADGYRQATGMRVVRLDDQHGYLRVPEPGLLSPGDLVSLGITHPCTSFDKWRVIPVVDDDDRVVDAVHTFF
jgi:D-serine deaminase-like pyridoxal phosphate-dependent protein